MIISLAPGDVVKRLRLEAAITELFDVAALPGIRCPVAVGPGTLESHGTLTFD